MFVISEIAPQFGDDIETAEQMILQSKFGGAKAVKVQLYPADLFTETPSDYLKARELNFDAYKRLVEYGERLNMPVFATAFTEERLAWCVELKQKYFKVAARTHAENPDLVERILSLGRTTFVSLPRGHDPRSVRSAENAIYLYCVTNYPTLLEEVELPDFRNSLFDGFSDHSIGISAAIYARSRGCKYLEKHFTLSHSWQLSNEKAHLGSMDVDQLRMIVRMSRDFDIMERKFAT